MCAIEHINFTVQVLYTSDNLKNKGFLKTERAIVVTPTGL